MRAIPFIVSVACCFLVGCGRQAAQSDLASQSLANEFQIETRTVLKHHWARIELLLVTGQGNRTVSLDDGRTGITANKTNGIFQVEIVMIAMLSHGERRLSWWMTQYTIENGQRTSGGGGSPQTFPLNADSSKTFYVSDVVDFRSVAGRHRYGQPVRLGNFLMNVSEKNPDLNLIIE
jgi:hypothetical protein